MDKCRETGGEKRCHIGDGDRGRVGRRLGHKRRTNESKKTLFKLVQAFVQLVIDGGVDVIKMLFKLVIDGGVDVIKTLFKLVVESSGDGRERGSIDGGIDVIRGEVRVALGAGTCFQAVSAGEETGGSQAVPAAAAAARLGGMVEGSFGWNDVGGNDKSSEREGNVGIQECIK